MERRCKASWDHLKVIAKHEMKPVLKQKMSEFLKDCAERIIILKIVHRRIMNRCALFLNLVLSLHFNRSHCPADTQQKYLEKIIVMALTG